MQRRIREFEHDWSRRGSAEQADSTMVHEAEHSHEARTSTPSRLPRSSPFIDPARLVEAQSSSKLRPPSARRKRSHRDHGSPTPQGTPTLVQVNENIISPRDSTVVRGMSAPHSVTPRRSLSRSSTPAARPGPGEYNLTNAIRTPGFATQKVKTCNCDDAPLHAAMPGGSMPSEPLKHP